MKTATLLSLLLLMLLTAACRNDDESAPGGLATPTWLREQIRQDEAAIAADSTQLPSYGAWIEVRFKNVFYYEYDNPLSSLSRNPYSVEGERINLASPAFTNYWNERCCERYLWQGSRYVRLD